MHILVRDTRSLDEAGQAVDLGQTPADLVFLSFSDSDLGAVARAWEDEAATLPELRLASLAALRHPMSVDLYTETVLVRAKAIVVRLLGGFDYWRYGAEEVARLAARDGIALALLPGDGRPDPRLQALSTVGARQYRRLDALFVQGGPENAARALRLMAALAGCGPEEDEAPVPVERHGRHAFAGSGPQDGPAAAIVFYRAHLLSGDTAPLDRLAEALRERGLRPAGLYAGSLKDADSALWIAGELRRLRPAVVLNATAFSARIGDASPLDAADAPVLQLALAGCDKAAWESSARGLGAADLAMQAVLPEADGRLGPLPVSFKESHGADARLQHRLMRHAPYRAGIAQAADLAAAWGLLRATPRGERRLALVLSDYPGGAGRLAHAVGLDAPASARAILRLLAAEGYEVAAADDGDLARRLEETPARPTLSLADYERLLPDSLRRRIEAAWGPPGQDPALRGGRFRHVFMRCGRLVLAVQPDRGERLTRKDSYHDPALAPRHGYAAFYLWLRAVESVHAMIHLGTHGSLEWLPGKAAALAQDCWPRVLAGALPVVYPFIVNNPGEAAAAKRRLCAVMIGHMTPPLGRAGAHGAVAELERLVDEYAAADGLDGRRLKLLQKDILARAGDTGLLRESGGDRAGSEDEALARLDAYLCDVKDVQIREGLHVFGEEPSPGALEKLAHLLTDKVNGDVNLIDLVRKSSLGERSGLLAALDGRFVPPGPSGAPTRGRLDVLPTGRNIFTVDPRAVPTRTGMVLGARAAEALLRRHLQDHGDYPSSVVIDLWGSATMRTGGEDLALALALLGARPVWDHGSNRVGGIEILTLAELNRPRVDVTLRISGLFRDCFADQIALYDEAVRAVARRDEDVAWNPLAAARLLDPVAFRRETIRVWGAAPGGFGAGVSDLVDAGAWSDRDELGADYLRVSAHAYGRGLDGVFDAEGFGRRVAGAEAFVHMQDHREHDLLEGPDFAAHEGGFAAAAGRLGANPVLYHGDASDPQAPRIRTLEEEIALTVRARATNPRWIDGMMRHGYRGAAEMARTLDGLHAFAAASGLDLGRQFEDYFAATLAAPAVEEFLRRENPNAYAHMVSRFGDAVARGLWRPRRNSVHAVLEGSP